MKQYGANKATEFTKKQIGVIFANAKNGNLKVENWVIKDFYKLADYYGYDYNKSAEQCEAEILKILEKVFDGNFSEAQELIDEYTEKHFELMGRKGQKQADRSYL